MRLWNVYGEGPLGMRLQPPSSWILSCLRNGTAASASGATHEQQLVHARDLADTLLAMMHSFDDLPPVVEATSGELLPPPFLLQCVRCMMGGCYGGDREASGPCSPRSRQASLVYSSLQAALAANSKWPLLAPPLFQALGHLMGSSGSTCRRPFLLLAT